MFIQAFNGVFCEFMDQLTVIIPNDIQVTMASSFCKGYIESHPDEIIGHFNEFVFPHRDLGRDALMDKMIILINEAPGGSSYSGKVEEAWGNCNGASRDVLMKYITTMVKLCEKAFQ